MSRLKIGRSASSDIVVQHQTVSRTHAEIEILGGGRYLLNDLDSTSGTEAWIDGKWVPARDLEVDGHTRVSLGDHETTIDALLKAARDNLSTKPPRSIAPVPRPPVRTEFDETAPGAAAKPRARAAAVKPIAGARTRFWLLVGGAAAFVVILIAIALVLVLQGTETSPVSVTRE